jgi:hypothetical protein
VNIAAPIMTGLHQVDNPVVDRDGNVSSPTAARADRKSVHLPRAANIPANVFVGIVNPA